MSKHTPEPWVAVRNTAYWEIGTEIDGYYAPRIGDVCATDPNHPDAGKQEANANRIVACVNACAGMDDPAAEIERLRARVEELEDQHRETVPPRLLAIEDQSLAACRGCVDEAVGIAERFAESGVRDKLIAAQFIYTLAGILSARAANGGEV